MFVPESALPGCKNAQRLIRQFHTWGPSFIQVNAALNTEGSSIELVDCGAPHVDAFKDDAVAIVTWLEKVLPCGTLSEIMRIHESYLGQCLLGRLRKES